VRATVRRTLPAPAPSRSRATPQQRTGEHTISIVFALISSLAFALSTVLQQRGTFQVPDISIRNPKSLLMLLTKPVWLVALGVMSVGWFFQALALDRGRVSVVQVFLTMTLVFVLPLGIWLTRQRVSAREWLAALVVVGGLSVFTAVGDPATGRDDASSGAWLLATVVVAFVCAAVLFYSDGGSASLRASANGLVSGSTAGLLAVMSKPVLSELHTGLTAVLTDPKFYIVGVLAVLGVVFQQFGLATGKLADTVAAGSVASPVVAVILGAILLEERLSPVHWQWLVAVGALGMAMAAAVVIATTPHPDLTRAEMEGRVLDPA
jgi:drug/metabolite transporter (DMT)-like permease